MIKNNSGELKISKDIVVIYHGECPDGFSAAWVAWKKFGTQADYVPGHHGEAPPKGLNGKEIYFLDFVYPADTMSEVVKDSARVIVLDHHKSAEESVKMAHQYVYEINHSGAVLAWQYFFPDLDVPWLLKYIEDVDLWKLKLPDIIAMILVLNTFNKDFQTWSKLAEELENKSVRHQYIEQGKIMSKYENKLLDEIMDSDKEVVEFEGYETYAINAPGIFASQIGNALCKEKPPIAIVWHWSGGKMEVSLRSDESVDVSDIAKKYGGGGHKAAAGFRIMTGQIFPWKTIKQNGKK